MDQHDFNHSTVENSRTGEGFRAFGHGLWTAVRPVLNSPTDKNQDRRQPQSHFDLYRTTIEKPML